MNPWHDIENFKDVPETVKAIIEIPKESKVKYELDKETGLLKLDRVLYSAVHYPANYGFIPQTYCDDKDPLDILVLGAEPAIPLCIIRAKPIGVMKMVDGGETDDKIIAVNVGDPGFNHYSHIDQLPPHTLINLQRFFKDYKKLEEKDVKIEMLLGPVDAKRIIIEAMQLYQKEKENLIKPCCCKGEKS